MPRVINPSNAKQELLAARAIYFSVVLVALGALPFVARIPQSPATHPSHVVSKDVPIPVRGGVILRADILLPAESGRFPTLVYRTPYNKESALKEHTTFERAVARGYAVVVQDVRGRYASDGEFNAYRNEGHDGYDTIEWAAKQPWSDGNVGTFGLSYPGAVQWLAAIENPPHLKAMAPAMTFSTPRNFFYSGGTFDGSWLDWIWFNIAPDIRHRKNLPGPKTHKEAAAAWETEHQRMQEFLPLRDLPDLKEVSTYYYEWLSHPPADPWWDWAELRNKYDRVHVSVLNLSGWYDEAYGPDGATTNFNGLLSARQAEKDPRTRTIIGPWTHGGQEESRSGERDFGPTAAIDYDELILHWMDHYVRGMDNGVDREKRVRLFVMGENVWRDEDTWPIQRAHSESFYLASKSADDRTGSLVPSVPDKTSPDSSFRSDPAKPFTDPYTDYGAHDYRALAGRSDVLVFDTDPLPADLEVTGPVRAEIYLSAGCRDVDLWVRLLDVALDGTALNLMSPGLDVLRASYRNEKSQPEFLKPGSIVRLNLDRLLTSNNFLAGHRIRIQLSGAFFPHFSRNLQTGSSEVNTSRTLPCTVKIFHSKKSPSRIILPVIPR
jgi:putative CocE/NonD family hydrolase